MAKAHMPHAARAVQIPTSEQFARPGVYFLYHQGVIVYVGQSQNMRRRIAEHIIEGVKQFDAIDGVPCDPQYLLQKEAVYIRRLLPKYNQCIPSKRARVYRDTMPLRERKLLGGPITAKLAAEYLGITLDDLLDLDRQGIGPKRRRVPRANMRRFVITDLKDYAEANRELLSRYGKLKTEAG